MTDAVTFVVPVHNGAACLAETLISIAAQADGRPIEVIVVDDGSEDRSGEVLETLADRYRLTVVRGPRRGAAAAINSGMRFASHPIVCQVDQDVVLERGWLTNLLPAFDDPSVAAVQGCYTNDRNASFCSRVMAVDLEQRYAAMSGDPDHVCTGNTAYRVAALQAIGMLDESIGYGYDNDLSYRLTAAGYRLVFRKDARSRHRWRDGLRGYLLQQYGFGYGRLDLVARHPRRWTGDAVSPAMMMAHPLAMALSAILFGLGMASAGVLVLLVLAFERIVAGVAAWRTFGDPAGLAFPVVHLARDAAWLAAIAVWTVRRMSACPCEPAHSMSGRKAATR